MFDVSWGELLVLGLATAALTGRQDLPAACRLVGTQLGRVVGLLQGARARVDQYAAHNELRQLQNELRSGLRELDQVRTELAVAASSQGMVGRTLGAMTPSVNRARGLGGIAAGGGGDALLSTTTASNTSLPGSTPPLGGTTVVNSAMPAGSASILGAGLSGSVGRNSLASNGAVFSQTVAWDDQPVRSDPNIPLVYSSASHSEKAILEDEWEKQGIGYQTRAEQMFRERNKNSVTGGSPSSGSELLAALIKQNLIWDQYDRVVGEQDSQLQDRIEAIKAKRQDQEANGVTDSNDR